MRVFSSLKTVLVGNELPFIVIDSGKKASAFSNTACTRVRMILLAFEMVDL